MGNLSNYESFEVGRERMDRLRALGGVAQEIVNKMAMLSQEYNNYRVGLGGDVEDEAYSDASLSYMCDQLKPSLDALTEEQRGWLNIVLDSLGYVPKV